MREVRVHVVGEVSGEIRVGDRDGPELLHVPEDDEGATGIDLDVGDGEIGEVLEAGEPDAGEAAEAGDGGEGAEIEGEIGGEANRSDRTVEELEGLEGGKGLEGREGQSDVVGAVGKLESEEVSEGLGVVAESDVVADQSWLRAGVSGGRNVERLESC